MKEKAYNYDVLLELVLDLGECLICSGAEISRVEDTISRMAKAYGADKVDVFAVASVIFLSVTFDDKVYSHSRRIKSNGSNDFCKIEALNDLSRRCCKNRLDIDDLKREINNIKNVNPVRARVYIGAVLSAASFSVFFGGKVYDLLLSGLFALVICFLSSILSPRISNKVFYYFVTSLLIGFGICLVARYFPVINADKVIIGDIMVLVPGVVMTNSVKNMLIGETLSAVMKLVECFVWTCALACGFMIPISILLGG